MSDPANLVLVLTSLLRFVSIFIALWLAFRSELRVAALLQGERASPPGAAFRSLIWLGLGAVFAMPLFDLVSLIQQSVELVAPRSWGLAVGGIPTFWGTVPPRVFDALSGGTTLAVYAITSSLLWRHFRDPSLPIFSAVAPSPANRILLTLATAGIIHLIVTTIVVSLVFVQLPTAVSPLAAGVAGFVGAWLIGLLLVLALVLWMHLQLQPDDAKA